MKSKYFHFLQKVFPQVGQGCAIGFVNDDEIKSNDRSPLLLGSNPVAAAFAFAKLRKKLRRSQNHNQEWCVVR